MNEEQQRLEHAARLVRILGNVENAYVSDGWLSVGMILSPLDPAEIREVAEWLTDFAQTRSGTDNGSGSEKSPAGSTRGDLPSPPAFVTTPDEYPLAAGSSAPYDYETEGLGGT